MTGQQLKNSILQMAVQGKLVPQDPNDEPASVLLERIRVEKDALIKAGKIKKEKNPSVIFRGADNLPYEKVGKNEPVCIADEVPFDIPDSWEWVRFSSVIELQSGQDMTPDKYNSTQHGIPYLTGASNIENEKVIINRWTEYGKAFAYKGDLLITCKGTVGTMAVLEENQVHIARQIMAIRSSKFIKIAYIQLVLETLVASLKAAAKSMIPGISREDILSSLLPLPPYNEQGKIIDFFRCITPFVAEYSKKESLLQDLNSAFPDLLKKSILQEAVQGKLVPQDENDEPASVLLERIRAEKQALIEAGKIKKDKNESVIFRRDNSHYEKRGSETICIDDEISFEIPTSWEWCRLSSVAYSIFAGGDKPKDFTTKPTEVNKYPVIANGITNDGILGYTATPTANANTITVAGRGTIGFSLYRTYEYCPIVRLIVIEQCQGITPQYLQYVLEAFPEKSLGTSIPQLTVPMLKPKLIPIPPLSEQNRIVNQIEKLLPTLRLL